MENCKPADFKQLAFAAQPLLGWFVTLLANIPRISHLKNLKSVKVMQCNSLPHKLRKSELIGNVSSAPLSAIPTNASARVGCS